MKKRPLLCKPRAYMACVALAFVSALLYRAKVTPGTHRFREALSVPSPAPSLIARVQPDSTPSPGHSAQRQQQLQHEEPNFCAPPWRERDDARAKKSGVVFATAATQNHFYSVQYLVVNAKRVDPQRQIVVYDLGFDLERQALLQCSGNVIVRRFPYEKYPAFVNATINAGQYAWKPLLIQQLLSEWDGVIWSDAGNRYLTSLDPLMCVPPPASLTRTRTPRRYKSTYARELGNGFYSDDSAGLVGSFMHPGLLKYFGFGALESTLPNCNAALLVFLHSSADLVKAWADCALVEQCIAPEGSSRKNHRQDQSVLTFLVYSGLLQGNVSAPRFRCGSVMPNRRLYSAHHDAKHDYRLVSALAVPVSKVSAHRHIATALRFAHAPTTVVPATDSLDSALLVLTLLLGTHNDPRFVLVIAADDDDEWSALAVLSTLGNQSGLTLIRVRCTTPEAPFASSSSVDKMTNGSLRYRFAQRPLMKRHCIPATDDAKWHDVARANGPEGGRYHFVLMTAGGVRSALVNNVNALVGLVKRSSRIGWGIVAQVDASSAPAYASVLARVPGGCLHANLGVVSTSFANVTALASWR